MIAADILTDIALLNNEADVSENGSDESKALTAISMAIRYCYTVAAAIQGVLGTRGPNPITTTANQEFTPKPAELLRVDSLWALDVVTKRPIWSLRHIQESGGHAPSLPWPLNWVVAPSTGQPYAYDEDAAAWYWVPTPDLSTYEIRANGLWLPDAIADRVSPLNLPGNAATVLQTPLASFASKYMALSVGDDTATLQSLAVETFTPALRALKTRDRSRAQSRQYTYAHST